MLIFHKKILVLIGEMPINEWARAHNIPAQTVHGWIKDGRVPRGANLDLLIRATGKSKGWWFDGDADAPYTSADNVIAPVVNHKLKKYDDAIYIDSYPEVRAAAGAGQLTPTDQVIVKVAINAADWRNYIGLDHKHVKLITVHGDSMKPALSHGDQVLVDTAVSDFVDDAIYCLQQNDLTRFKRIKLRLDGSIEVRSDNEQAGFKSESYTADEAANFKLIGKVIPFKFGRFDL